MIEIVVKLCESKIYNKLEYFFELLNKGIGVKILPRKIKKIFIILKRKINRVIKSMRREGRTDGERMYFYRLISKFMPDFIKVWRRGIV